MRSKAKIIAIVMIFLFLILGFAGYEQSVFRLVSSSPRNNGDQPITNDLVFTFSKPLHASMKDKFKLDPYTAGFVTINDTKLTFHPSSSLLIDHPYTATISTPTSITGKVLNDITIHFTAKYIPFSQTSKNQQQESINSSNSLESKYPIVSYLPHETSHYKIDYKLLTDGKMQLTIDLYAILNNANQQATYMASLRQYQGEAIDYLQSIHVKPNDYTIVYSPNPDTGN